MSSLDELVVAARAGGDWAFERIWRELAGQVAGYLRARGVLEFEDATSEVFLAAFKGLRGFEGDGAAFRSWIFTIAHHRSVDEYRRALRSAVPVGPSVSDERSAPSAEPLALEGMGLSELVAKLPPGQREVILLRFVADLSLEEVAKITGRRVSAVKQLQRRGVHRLRRHLDGPTSGTPISPADLQPIAEAR